MKRATATRQFIVEADVVDKDGKILADESYSTGGPRETNVRKISDYRNPVPYEPESEDREFNAWLSRESDAQMLREDAERQAAAERNAQLLMDGTSWVFRNVVKPIAEAYWEAGGRDRMQQFGRWLAKPRGRRAREAVEERLASVHEQSESVMVDEAGETPEGVIVLDDYRERRSA